MSNLPGSSRRRDISDGVATMAIKEEVIDRTSKLTPLVSRSSHQDTTSVNSLQAESSISSSPPKKDKTVKDPPFEVVDVLTSRNLDVRDKLLSKFFRCFHFPTVCNFSSNDVDQFRDHLLEKHAFDKKLKCHYCGVRDSKIFQDSSLLIDHILSNHTHRRYQCNLCLYRGSYLLQVHLHFIDCHTDNYELLYGQSSLTSSYPELPSSIQRTNPLGIKKLALPRVLLCPLVCSPFPVMKESLIFSTRRAERINRFTDTNEYRDFFQCVYCKVIHKHKDLVLLHLAKTHADLPLLYYPSGTSELPKKETPAAVIKPEHIEFHPDHWNVFDPQNSRPREDQRETIPEFGRPLRRTTIEVVDETAARVKQPQPTNSWTEDEDDMYFTDDRHDNPIEDDLRLSDEETEPNQVVKPGTPSKKRIATPGLTPRRTPKKRRRSTDFGDDNEPDTEEPDILSHLRKQGVQVEKERLVQPIQVVPTSKANPGIKHKKCLFRECNQIVLESKIELHMDSQHGTSHTMKCEDCEFINSKLAVKLHIKEEHNGRGKVVCLMVPVDDEIPLVVEIVNLGESSGTVRRGVLPTDPLPLNSTKKSLTTTTSRPKTPNPFRKKKNEEPPKGHLLEKVKQSTFQGPLKNDRTDRARRASDDND